MGQFNNMCVFFKDLSCVLVDWATTIYNIHDFMSFFPDGDQFNALEEAEDILMSLVDMDDFFWFIDRLEAKNMI